MQVFVDESRRRDQYLLGVVMVPSGALAQLRTAIRGSVLRGQRRVHFGDEGNERRKQLMRNWLELRSECAVFVVQGTAFHTEAAAREACLTRVVAVAPQEGATRLVIESREGQDQADRRLLSTLIKTDSELTYEHLRPHEEPILWFADGVAWCWGAGGVFRQPLDASEHFRVQATPLVLGGHAVP